MEVPFKEAIRNRYAAAARSAQESEHGGCCGSDCGCDPVTRDIYLSDELELLPEGAVRASLGCGNPTALIDLHAGEHVLDLGSGGGIDVLLSARRVGPEGRAYGLDMTDEMLELARKNQHEAGITNAVFLKGEIEAIPLPDASVDVIISNCVINLSSDKDRVLAEAFRVLRPGGRFAVSDVIFQGDMSLLPPERERQVAAWAGCVAGALEEKDYLARLVRAGFVETGIQVTRTYGPEPFQNAGMAPPVGVALASAFIRGQKPLS